MSPRAVFLSVTVSTPLAFSWRAPYGFQMSLATRLTALHFQETVCLGVWSQVYGPLEKVWHSRQVAPEQPFQGSPTVNIYVQNPVL